MKSKTVEKITGQFYKHFKTERAIFLSQIHGITSNAEREWYTSLLLCRLMVLYFLQQRGFLAGDNNYLANQLSKIRGSFYRRFLLGTIPYLNGDFFTRHAIERRYPRIQIPNTAFARLFSFFSSYRWRLDEHAPHEKNTITPGILGYILEQYMNQQQMGAYYTKEDVTGYIVTQTIVPALFDAVERQWPGALSTEAPIWQLLSATPDRYIHATVREPQPRPGETLAEQTRYSALRAALTTRQFQSIDALITHNLDIQRFACDGLQAITEPELLRTFYSSLRQLTILDPTCGSGAFLFAALNVLEELYHTCLERMQTLAPDTFATELDEVRQHPNQRYFIVHSIISHNLYGVDLMAEAIEICKLRLFLTLIARVEQSSEIKTPPHIRHHLRNGNALVGFTTLPPNASAHQTRTTLNRQLALQTGINATDATAFQSWCTSHQPFHWCLEFADIQARGGFDIILGNPPYVEYNQKRFSYRLCDFETLACGNLYPCVIERCHQLLASGGRHSMILPLAAFATRNMTPLLENFRRWYPRSWLSFYHFRPAMLFSGSKSASIPTAIYLARSSGPEQRYSTSLNKWSVEQRQGLFERLTYCAITAPPDPTNRHYYPKFGLDCENAIMRKLLLHRSIDGYLASVPNHNTMHYRSAGGLYWKVFVNYPWPYYATSNKQCSFAESYERDIFVALFNSSLFWWYYTVTFDTFNLKDYMLFGFRFTYPHDSTLLAELRTHCQRLMQDFSLHARHLKRGQTDSYTIYARKSKTIIDDIDRSLARHYDLSSTELDFIINYDLKYRMGLESNGP